MLSGRNKELLDAAETALGSSAAILRDWYFQKKLGWAVYWTPDTPVNLAAKRRDVASLIWC